MSVHSSGVVAVAVVGTAFAVAVGLRVGELRHHPIVEHTARSPPSSSAQSRHLARWAAVG